MDHVAIMSKNLGLIDRILSGHKTIETRWYKNRSTPYNKINVNDKIYFKDSGGLVRAYATVSDFKQYQLFSIEDSQKLVDRYGGVGQIDIHHRDASQWAIGKKYAILIWLKSPQKVNPFAINKAGFGIGCAWITVKDINTIRVSADSRPAV